MKLVAKYNMRSNSKVRVDKSVGISIYDWFYLKATYMCNKTVKGEIGTDTLRHLALETMNTRYPSDKWLHIFTDGC